MFSSSIMNIETNVNVQWYNNKSDVDFILLTKGDLVCLKLTNTNSTLRQLTTTKATLHMTTKNSKTIINEGVIGA